MASKDGVHIPLQPKAQLGKVRRDSKGGCGHPNFPAWDVDWREQELEEEGVRCLPRSFLFLRQKMTPQKEKKT